MSAGGRDMLRWGLCFALALAFHSAGAAALLARWHDDDDRLANAPVIMLELAPAPVAPTMVPTDIPPGPQQAEAQVEPEPIKPVEMAVLPPAENPELTATVPKTVERPKGKVPKKKHASPASAPSSTEQHAERAAAPAPGAAGLNTNALANWRSRLYAQIERFKRAPSQNRGVTYLAFNVDRSGGVHNARIVTSSGSAELDRATLQMIERAQPLPPPPPEIPGAHIPVTVPIRYNFR